MAVKKEGWHLVLLLDEFDVVLNHPSLGSGEFFSKLRTLTSRFGHALSMIIASRQSVAELNMQTQHLTGGSPFFNTAWELPLKPFDEKAARQVLQRGGKDKRFSEEEVRFILRIAGGHPYLLQYAGAALWDAYESEMPPSERKEYVGQELLRTAESALAVTWHNWSADKRKAFALIALDQAPLLLGKREFDLEKLRDAALACRAEVRYLEDRGFITKEERYPSGYCATAEVMLWWLSEKLLELLRQAGTESEEELGQFLAREEWLGLFKRGEREQWVKAVRALGQFAGEGARVFIREAAAGLGRGIVSG